MNVIESLENEYMNKVSLHLLQFHFQFTFEFVGGGIVVYVLFCECGIMNE